MKHRQITDPAAYGGQSRAERLMGLMESNLGYAPGFRRAHARGIGLRGRFTALPAAAELTTASHMQGDEIAVVARLSNGAGSPYAVDRTSEKRGGVLGMGVRFALPGGRHAAWAALNVESFPARKPDHFIGLTAARAKGLPFGLSQPAALRELPPDAPCGAAGRQGDPRSADGGVVRHRAVLRAARVHRRRRRRRPAGVSLPLGPGGGAGLDERRRRPHPAAAVPAVARFASASPAGPSPGTSSSSSPSRATRPTTSRSAGPTSARWSPSGGCSSTESTRTRSPWTGWCSTRPSCRRASSCPTTRCCTFARRPTPRHTSAARTRRSRRSRRSRGGHVRGRSMPVGVPMRRLLAANAALAVVLLLHIADHVVRQPADEQLGLVASLPGLLGTVAVFVSLGLVARRPAVRAGARRRRSASPRRSASSPSTSPRTGRCSATRTPTATSTPARGSRCRRTLACGLWLAYEGWRVTSTRRPAGCSAASAAPRSSAR